MNTVLERNLCAGGSLSHRFPLPLLTRGWAAALAGSWSHHAFPRPFSALLPPAVTQFALAGKARDRTGNFRTF